MNFNLRIRKVSCLAFALWIAAGAIASVSGQEQEDRSLWRVEEKMEIFGRLLESPAGQILPWGLERPAWDRFLSEFGFLAQGEAPWRENSRDLGTRWLYKSANGITMEVYERGSLGVAFAVPLIVWTPGQPQPPEPRDLAPKLNQFCSLAEVAGCPEGGIIWQRGEGAVGISYRPPSESDNPQEDEPDDVVDVLLLVAYASAHVVPCGEE